MARVRKLQTRFTQGEIDPRMIGRVDIDQYYGAAETMTNVFALPQGGFTRRPGLEYIAELMPRLTRDTAGTYTATNGGTAAEGHDNDIATVMQTTGNISTTNPYVVMHIDLLTAQDIVFIDVLNTGVTAGSNATEFKLQVSTDNSAWTTVGTVPMTTTLRDKRARVNGSYRYVRFARIGATDMTTAKVNLAEIVVWTDAGTLSNSRLIDFVFSTSQTYMMVATENNLAVYKEGVLQCDIPVQDVNIVEGLDNALIPGLSWTQSADTILFFHPDLKPFKVQRNGADDDWLASTITFDYIPKYAFTPTESNPAQTLTPSAVSGNITLTAGGAVFSASDVGQYISGNAGRARIVAYTSTTVADAVVEIPFFDTGAIASGAWTLEAGYEDVWSTTRGWPNCGVFHEGRLWLGGSESRPSTVWGSRVALFFDFDPGTLLDDDAIDASLDTGQFNKIINLYSGRTLQIMTTGGEHAVLQQLNEPITPSNFNAKKQTSIGSRENVRLAEVEGIVLFVQREGESVQGMVYDDTQQAFTNKLVSLISSHLIITPVDFALRKATSTSDGNYLLIVNSDGTLTVGCLHIAQNIAALTPQETDGLFKACGVDNDEMWFVVERTINSATVRYIERFNFDYTTDAAMRSTTGVPTDTFSGFDHLEGEEVKVVIDGDDVITTAVASGAIAISGIVVSVQPFEITISAGETSGTADIDAVTSARTAIFMGGFTTENTGTAYREIMPRVELTTDELVTAFRNTASDDYAITIRGVVVEFSARAVTAVQHGTVTINSGQTSGTATVSSASTTLSAPNLLGFTLSTTETDPSKFMPRLEQTNATTITARRQVASAAVLTVGFCIITFKSYILSKLQKVTASSIASGALTSESALSPAFNVNRTLLLNAGVVSSSTAINDFLCGIRLQGPSAVLVSRKAGSAAAFINFTALEFKADVINKVQRGGVPLNENVSSNSDDILEIDQDRGFINSLGNSSESGTADERFAAAFLDTDDTVAAERNTAGGGGESAEQFYEVVEFEDVPDEAATYVEVGLDYTPEVIDLPVEEERIGTVLGRKKNISEINLQLHQTKNIVVQGKRQDFTGFLEADGNDDSTGFTGIKRIKGVRGWDLTGQVTITQDKPLPMTVLAQAKKVNV